MRPNNKLTALYFGNCNELFPQGFALAKFDEAAIAINL